MGGHVSNSHLSVALSHEQNEHSVILYDSPCRKIFPSLFWHGNSLGGPETSPDSFPDAELELEDDTPSVVKKTAAKTRSRPQ